MVLMNAFLYNSEATTCLEDIEELVDFLKVDGGENLSSSETSNNNKKE